MEASRSVREEGEDGEMIKKPQPSADEFDVVLMFLLSLTFSSHSQLGFGSSL